MTFKFRTTNPQGDDLEVSLLAKDVVEILCAKDGTAMIDTGLEWRRTCEPYGMVAARLRAARLAAGLTA